MILAIDTSTRNGSVAVADEGRIVASRAWYAAVSHSTELMPAVVQILAGVGIHPRGLDAVAVALGPGGFSALRTGLSVAKGMAMAAKVPIIGISSLDLEAYPFRNARVAVCAILEAGRGEAASALFDSAGARVRDDRISGPEELLEELETMAEGTFLFCGEGLPPWMEVIESRLGRRALLCDVPPSSRSGSLAAMAYGRLQAGETDSLDQLQPEYLRMPNIGVSRRRDRRPQASSRRSRRSREAQ